MTLHCKLLESHKNLNKAICFSQRNFKYFDSFVYFRFPEEIIRSVLSFLFMLLGLMGCGAGNHGV